MKPNRYSWDVVIYFEYWQKGMDLPGLADKNVNTWG